MQALLLIGVSRGSAGKEVKCLYAGLDGVALQKAAQEAAATKKYVEIGKIVNPACTPMPIDPTPTTATTPVFTRPKAKEIAQSKRNPLDDVQDDIRARRKNRLNASLSKDAAKKSESESHADSKQEQEGKYPGGANVVILRQDGPTLEEYVKAGYEPENYPPKGFAEKDSAGLLLYRANNAQKPAGGQSTSTSLSGDTAGVSLADASVGDNK